MTPKQQSSEYFSNVTTLAIVLATLALAVGPLLAG